MASLAWHVVDIPGGHPLVVYRLGIVLASVISKRLMASIEF